LIQGTKFIPLPGVQAAEPGLQWHVKLDSRAGRQAVANEDLKAGTLVHIERPFLTVPISKVASVVCHRCSRPLQQGNAPVQGGNPCLPRYCPRCKELPHEVDAKLAALRIKLPEIATQNSIEPTMLHIVMLLDLQRSGIDAGVPPPASERTGGLIPNPADGHPEVKTTVADFDVLPNFWDKKSEDWRKKVGPAVRALHKELVALAESGALPGYTPSPLTRLQADVAGMSLHLRPFSVTTGRDTAIGIFPALYMFQHSCSPNAHFIVLGNQLYVRTIVDVAKDEPITVCYASPTDPRAARQQALEADRHFTCACTRCTQPLKESVDRWLEGMYCQRCGVDVVVELPPGPDNDAAVVKWKQQVAEDLQLVEKLEEKKAAKAGKGGKGKRPTQNKKGDGPNGAADGEGQAPGEEQAAGEDAAPQGAVNEENDLSVVPEGAIFWECCKCGWVEPGLNAVQKGPADIVLQATRMLQQGAAFVNIKHPDLVAQGEAMLEAVASGMEGRLPQYNVRALEALAALVQVNQRKGDAMKALNYAITLWDTERQLMDNRPTVQQLQCLDAIIDAAEHKAAKSSSPAVKQGFQRRIKIANQYLKETRKVLLGR